MSNVQSALPLFVLLGRRGAGKSAFLAHCGAARGQQAHFAEHDVPDDPRAGERERKALVAELAKLARPLAGVLVLVPLGDLRNDAYYTALRSALDAVVTGCGAHVPIHLIVTHVDVVPSYAEFVVATSRHPIALGVRQALSNRSDPNRWNAPVAALLDGVLETSVAVMNGAAKSSPLRFGIGLHALAQPLAGWLCRLETPTRGAEALSPRSVFLTSSIGHDRASHTELAMQAILEDAELSRVTSRRLTKAALRWTLPTSVPIAAVAIATSAYLLLRSPPQPEPTAPTVAEAPADPAKPKLPGFVADARPPGPRFPPPVCAAASAASGEWHFQTMVTATNAGSESGIGIRGIYTLALDATECELELKVTKTGYVSPAGASTTYAKPQIGTDPLNVAFVEASGDTEVLWLPVVLDMNNESRSDRLEQEFIIGFRLDGGEAKRITGEWRQAGSARNSTGYWGYIEGGRDSIEPAGASAQVCRVQCRLACGWSEQARVDRCRESCAADVLLAVTACPS